MILFVITDFFRRRKPRRAQDEMPVEPLLLMLIFWTLFGLGALMGGVAIVAAIGTDWAISVSFALAAASALAGSIAVWRHLNRS